jgi:hypothetical protein
MFDINRKDHPGNNYILYYVKQLNCSYINYSYSNVNLFKNSNIDIDVSNANGDNLLHIFVKERQFTHCKSSLVHHKPLLLTNNDNQTTFFDPELIELFLKAGADISEVQTLLVQYNSGQVLRAFIDAMAEKYPPFDLKNMKSKIICYTTYNLRAL